jgi:hypothetical protein
MLRPRRREPTAEGDDRWVCESNPVYLNDQRDLIRSQAGYNKSRRVRWLFGIGRRIQEKAAARLDLPLDVSRCENSPTSLSSSQRAERASLSDW